MTRTYEVNADGGRSYTSNSAAKVADVAVTWEQQGHRPKVYVSIVGDRVTCREVEITSKKQTARALAAA